MAQQFIFTYTSLKMLDISFEWHLKCKSRLPLHPCSLKSKSSEKSPKQLQHADSKLSYWSHHQQVSDQSSRSGTWTVRHLNSKSEEPQYLKYTLELSTTRTVNLCLANMAVLLQAVGKCSGYLKLTCWVSLWALKRRAISFFKGASSYLAVFFCKSQLCEHWD